MRAARRGLIALEVGVDLLLDAGLSRIARKSTSLAALFIREAMRGCDSLELLGPSYGEARGSHVAFRHPRAASIAKKLVRAGLIGDFRPPDVLRFGITPLYTTYEEIGRAAALLREACKDRPRPL